MSNLTYNEWDIPLPLIQEFIKELGKICFPLGKIEF